MAQFLPAGPGDSAGRTRNGTPIDIFDHIGIQRDEPAPGMTFEAAWGKDGAVCVSHTRLLDVLSTAALAELCPDPSIASRLSGCC